MSLRRGILNIYKFDAIVYKKFRYYTNLYIRLHNLFLYTEHRIVKEKEKYYVYQEYGVSGFWEVDGTESLMLCVIAGHHADVQFKPVKDLKSMEIWVRKRFV